MSSATQPQDCAAGPGDAHTNRQRPEANSPDQQETEAARLWRAAREERVNGRLHDALFFYERAAPLLRAGETEPAALAAFRAEFASLLARLGEAERREDYTDRALSEYTDAARDFGRAGDTARQSAVAHCHARLLVTLERTAQAHAQLERARALLGDDADDAARAALDETRARVLLAEARHHEAEELSRAVVEKIKECGASPSGDASTSSSSSSSNVSSSSSGASSSSLLAAALTTRGVALARLARVEEARDAFLRAESAAAGDAEAGGLAALALVEELCGRLPFAEMSEAFEHAAARLAPTQSVTLCERLCAAARRVISVAAAREAEPSWEGFSFRDAVHRYEGVVIARALADAGGSVSRAAHLLGFRHHNSLASILNNRHRELLNERSPIKPRRRSIITVRERPRAPRFAGAGRASIVLHVEDDPVVADAVRFALEAEGCRVETCADGAEALARLQRTAVYDLLLLDQELPGVDGLDITREVRALAHRRALPVVFFSAVERGDEALAAGADLFLRKPEDADTLPAAVRRLLQRQPKKAADGARQQ